MKNKALKDIQLERSIFDYVKEEKEYQLSLGIKPNANSQEVTNFMSNFKLSEDEKNNPDVRNKYYDSYNKIQETKKLFTKTLSAVSMFKALKLEHDRFSNDKTASDTLKKVSYENLVYYEKSLKELGVSSELLSRCMEEPKYERLLREEFADRIVEDMHNIAKENSSELSLEDYYLRENSFKELGENQAFAPSLGSREKETVMGFIKIPATTFFRHVLEPDDSYKSLNKPLNFEYYELKNGEYQEKEVPKGFFSSIIYKIKRFFSDERKIINEEKDALKKLQTENEGKKLDLESFEEAKIENNQINEKENNELVNRIDNEIQKDEIVNTNSFSINDIEPVEDKALDIENQEVGNTNNDIPTASN